MEFDVETLETKRRLDTAYPNSVVSLGGVELFSTAHPSRCPLTNQTLNYFLELRPLSASNVALLVRTDKDLRRTVVGRVPVGPDIPYVHDFSVTADGKAILIFPPLRITDIGDLTRGPFFDGLKWMPDLGTQVVPTNI